MGLERQDIVGLGMKEKWEKKGKTGEGLFHFFSDPWDVNGSSSCSPHWTLKG